MQHLKNTLIPALFFALATALLAGCYPMGTSSGQNILAAQHSSGREFADYWYSGEAEVNSYQLMQSRYTERRNGKSVLIFVTEDFSKSRQVKLDNPGAAGKDKVPVMKLNNIRKFVTGIYDYSMMASIFTPVDVEKYPHSLKSTTTSQEWCGHSFTQLNLKGNNYHLSGYSYFEEEGDVQRKLGEALLEDELWTRLRIRPESIPLGEVDLIPSGFYNRLLHQPLKPRRASIRIENSEAEARLIVEYLHIDRALTIGFEPQFPHRILNWTEKNVKEVLSSGKLIKTLKAAYWRQHGNADVYLRDSLLLD
jgi:hypothetical protein